METPDTCRDGGNTFTPERYRLELNSAHTFTGRQAPSDPHTVSGVFFFFEKTKLECGKKPPAFRQRQAHNAVRHAARSRPARSTPGHRARTRASRAAGQVNQRKLRVNPGLTLNPKGFVFQLATPRLGYSPNLTTRTRREPAVMKPRDCRQVSHKDEVAARLSR